MSLFFCIVNDIFIPVLYEILVLFITTLLSLFHWLAINISMYERILFKRSKVPKDDICYIVPETPNIDIFVRFIVEVCSLFHILQSAIPW